MSEREKVWWEVHDEDGDAVHGLDGVATFESEDEGARVARVLAERVYPEQALTVVRIARTAHRRFRLRKDVEELPLEACDAEA